MTIDFNDPLALRTFALEFHKSVNRWDEELEEKSSYQVMKDRMDICYACDKFNEKIIECSECGCNLMIKAATIFEECPLDKWDWDEEGWNNQYFDPIVRNMPDEYTEFFVNHGIIQPGSGNQDAEEEVEDADKADTTD